MMVRVLNREAMVQIGRYVDNDTWVAGKILEALRACAAVARARDAAQRLRAIRGTAVAVAEHARAGAVTAHDRATLERLMTEIQNGRPPNRRRPP